MERAPAQQRGAGGHFYLPLIARRLSKIETAMMAPWPVGVGPRLSDPLRPGFGEFRAGHYSLIRWWRGAHNHGVA